MIQKLLIANRGEIACRIMRTARAMGIATVAVYSDADAKALHVRSADESVHIGPSPAAESYLVGAKIIAAAQQTGADAIHPGYGFLSENADFAQAVLDAGLVWVGPKPASIRAMGLKDAAKQLMRAAGVPVTPGYDGSDQSVERLTKEAEAIGYPVLIKAVAGGGGKGMRKVDAPADFAAALESCRREAKASFGNDEVLLEKWITSPRHIEVQVFGDAHGNVVHLFERDCSLQRRHQKVIEEAPAPGMDEATREAICAAAVRAAKAVDYEGAGTIEFIADASEGLRADRIFFMEMNTRLQVEHPVTEEITGVDLVEWQLRVASGEPLPKRQDELSIDGHSIEARLYAEDPAKGFLPSTGRLEYFRLPHLTRKRRFRNETGVQKGDEISPFYDPMIAKLVVHADTRQDAIEAMKDMTSGVECWPVKSNAGFLNLLLYDQDFEDGTMDTGLIGNNLDDFIPDERPSNKALQSVAHMVIDKVLGGKATDIRETYLATDKGPWSNLGLRLNRDKAPATVRLTEGANDYEFAFTDQSIDESLWVEETPHGYLVTDDGVTRMLRIARAGGEGQASAADGAIIAPMPGKVIAVDVAEGQAVTAGQRLMVLEAMKMEHALTAPFDGVVEGLAVSAGGQVQVEAVLCRVVPAGE
ncbi:acetyl/propionyl/methylcrotonyl-CoA carboxylase subunit alpha [Porphyrobacter sp. YT40]|uniref:acetyl/propionyl/methylcrotonyl-CoA carboxylase subunit alpha n=1 Tax=Porphyrobacter sp. YT40 TaxID=2547601 RepID=UPI00114329A6|nr:acetyl/propionyl/methylcrotonyl-CoA carboxylase subunit alpha [Porphyrobacter sp. YT40]QDH35888.1 acetyl/propionyl/methylcrotonyl-CoA carboxylase subunit alpha [Porphyrobacter sp. YT40]